MPKCGTSTLFNALNSHPEICGSVPKETYYLIDQHSPFYSENNFSKNGIEGWNRFFPSAQLKQVRYFLEATTHTIFQHSALTHFSRNNRNLKLIVMLREPVDRIQSSFYYTKNNLGNIHPSVTFDTYADDLLNNGSFEYIGNPSSRYVLSRELEYSDYPKVLKPWLDDFNKNQLYIGCFENMVSSPVKFYHDLLQWLRIESIELTSEPRNKTISPKNVTIHQTLIRLNKKIKFIPFKKSIKHVYLKFCSNGPVAGKNSDTDARLKLKSYFSKSNEILRKDYSIEFDQWNN